MKRTALVCVLFVAGAALWSAGLAARGESPAASNERGVPSCDAARHRLTTGTLGSCAFQTGRPVPIGATRDVLHGSPAAQRMERTPDIHFVPTPREVVDAMLEAAEVGPSDVVYDLGSGDGRIVIAAARLGARGVGIDLDPSLVAEATRNARKAGVLDRVRFVTGDIFKTDLSQATVVTTYLLTSINMRLRPKLIRELKPGSRIVSHRFRMGDWEPERAIKVGAADVFLWRVPARE